MKQQKFVIYKILGRGGGGVSLKQQYICITNIQHRLISKHAQSMHTNSKDLFDN